MGNKKRKNSNYVTEKNILAKEKRDEALRKKKIKKRVMIITIATVATILVVGAILGIGYLCGMFEYYPEATYHATIEIKDYGTIHLELYGNDAPETVAHFIKLANAGYFTNLEIHKLFDGALYGGSLNAGYNDKGIKGEFKNNGFKNKVSHKRGTISLSHLEDNNDSGYGQFFIVNEDSPELDGEYAAFGKVTSGMEIIDKIFENTKVDTNGVINSASRPIIKSVTVHATH